MKIYLFMETFYLIKLLGYYKDCIWVTQTQLESAQFKYKIIASLKPKCLK